MNDEELKAIVGKALDSSLTISSELESDQGDALDYYFGRPYGNEADGRSEVVTREVMETIEWIMPSLMRVFASGSKVAEFDPVSMEDEAAAEFESDVVNHVFMKDNRGFEVLHNWFKDALMQKVGYVKAFWSDEEEVVTESYTGLTDEGLAQLLEDDVEPVEHEEFEAVVETEAGPLIATTHDVKVKRVTKKGDLVVLNIPQEEMRVSKQASSICLDNVDFVAHESQKTASDLIEMGYAKSLVDQLGDQEGVGELEASREEYSENDEDYHDDSTRPITVSECYIRCDYDGDGIAELRRVVVSGNHVLENDEWDVIPFAALTPIMMPHKHVGLSEADLVMDIQKIKSTLVRQMLDNLYLTNNPEKEVLATQVNMSDLMRSLPGGIKRVKQMGSIREIPVPFTAGSSMPMLDILDGMKEARTGVSRHSMGLDADTLAKSTKGAFQTGLRQANQRLEMLARTFAETGVKDLFLKIHSLLIKHQDRTRDLKVNGEWVAINPSEWRDRNSMTVVVGVGTGDKAESLANLALIAEKQEQHLMNGSPLASLKNLYNTYERMIELSDLKEVERYFTDPDTIPPSPQEEPSNPLAEVEQIKGQFTLQAQQMKQEFEGQTKLMQMQASMELEAAKDAHKREMELVKAQISAMDKEADRRSREAIEAAKLEFQAFLEGYKVDIAQPGLGAGLDD